MATRGRGRGMGRGIAGRGARSTPSPGAPVRQPNPETLAHLGLTVETEGNEANGQFEDAEKVKEEQSTESANQTALIEGNQSNIETATPTAGNMKKENPTSNFNPKSPEFSPSETSKLNPTAPVFSPTGTPPQTSPASSSSSKLNPSTPEFSPTGLINGTGSGGNHGNTSHSNALSVSVFGKFPSPLNPRSGEFIPKSVTRSHGNPQPLNVAAPVFVPTLLTTMQNGELEERGTAGSTAGQADADIVREDEALSLKPNDIIHGFRYAVDQTGDVASESLLKAAAEMLIKATIYPASFERWKLKLENTVKAWPPIPDSLSNLAEMLIHWGIEETSLRLTTSRICQVLNDMEQLEGVFNQCLVARLKVWFEGRNLTDKDGLVNFSLFYAELFSRLKTKDRETPISVLGSAVFELLRQLLEAVEDRTVIGACQILKLTGCLLEDVLKDGDTSRMDNLIKTLEKFTTDETLPLSSQCVEIVVRVIELHARKWGRPTNSPSNPTTALNQFLFGAGVPPDVTDGSSGGGVSGDVSGVGGGVSGEATTFQVPVLNPDEWKEFLDDNDELIEDSEIPEAETEGYAIATESGQEDEMDAEMRKEFEFFVQDLEDHLLNMGEMDPEEFLEEKDPPPYTQ